MYEVALDPQAERERDGLQPEACAAFMELLAMLEVAPWGGKSFREDRPKGNMLTQPFGDGLGMATYFVLEERRLVYIVRIAWTG
ncbi:hypothetical protein AB0J42_12230 [Nonomuraea sp. NPDC049649]|uniref:hypothetical protein n=1 Tax=Nonomuraea sp. NPDC049649 TaxID=3155776 RepID=UPI003442B7C9